MEFPEKLRGLMDARGLTVREVGPLVGTSYGTVQRWTTGETTPDIDHTLALARLFGVPMELLADPGFVAPAPPGPARREIERLVGELGEEESLARLNLAYLRMAPAGPEGHAGRPHVPVVVTATRPGAPAGGATGASAPERDGGGQAG